MQTYLVRIKPKSSFGTPLHSDTIFGHLCWMYRYLYGEEKLKKDILNTYDTQPAFIVSNGFPKEHLPRPILPPLSQNELEAIIKKYFMTKPLKDKNGQLLSEREKRFYGLSILKKIKKEHFILAEDLLAIKDSLCEKAVTEMLLSRRITGQGKEIETSFKFKKEAFPHNTISRLSGTVVKEGGGFYHTQEEAYIGKEDFLEMDIYIKTEPSLLNKDRLRELFLALSQYGFGRDKSTGKGSFELVEIKEIELPQKGSAVMSLSYFIPGSSLKSGYYELFTKFGRLGGHYAISEIPFKSPLILMTPGSVFKVEEKRQYYGMAIKGIHKKEEIRHQTYLFPYFVTLLEAKDVL